jgi:hypothetical protein
MNIESIIGITSGSIAIIGAIIGTTRYIRSKYKKTPTTLLFAQLTDKNYLIKSVEKYSKN